MTTETGCRITTEELKHDRDREARQKRIDTLFAEKRRQFEAELTRGDIAEAAALFADMDAGDKAVSAYHADDYPELGLLLSAAISSWLTLQASKEVERMIDRGEV